MNSHVQRDASRNSIINVRSPARLDIRSLGTLILAIVGIVSFASPLQSAGPVVPNPIVIGPIPATVPPGHPSHNYPFFATTVDLASQGYVEEEFFFEGTANSYSILDPLATGTIQDGGHHYRTRMIVRRPASAQDFDGTVLMEWQNVASRYDLDALWAVSHEHLIRRGHAYIGVSALRAGIDTSSTGLKVWSQSRYGTLDVTEGGAILNDALSYDIFSQAAQAVKNPLGVDPMGGLQAERVFACGGSMAADRLVMYHNSIHPLAGVFDGFFIAIGGGLLRTDLDVKVFKILSETDITRNQAAIRQPDSDHFRRWEVAGAAHFGFDMAQALAPLRARDLPPSPPPSCSLPPFSRIPSHFAWNAAMDGLILWVKHNVAPPMAPEIDLLSITPTEAIVARDSFGNALGGIRLSQHAVPTAVNTGVNAGSAFCRLYGTYQPFDDATLDALYPNHGRYVSRVSKVAFENLQNGFIVIEDAVATVRDAAQSGIGKH